MSVGGLAGFALVFLVTVMTLSATGALVLGAARRWLQKAGPMVERRAAEAVAILPVMIGAIAVGALVVQSMLGADHCKVHDHHAHLCFTHGGNKLATHYSGCCQFLVEAGYELHIMRVEQLLLAQQLQVERSERGAGVTRDESGSLEAVALVEPVLLDRNAHNRLQACEEHLAVAQRVAVFKLYRVRSARRDCGYHAGPII